MIAIKYILENAGAAANCNAAGQTLGSFFGYGMFMALYSSEFCNKWLRTVPSDQGVVTIKGTFAFWGCVFLIITTLVALLKSEKNEKEDSKPPQILQTYKTMVKIMFLKPVKILLLVWFTCNVGSMASGEIAMLKITERGVSRANMALLSRKWLEKTRMSNYRVLEVLPKKFSNCFFHQF